MGIRSDLSTLAYDMIKKQLVVLFNWTFDKAAGFDQKSSK